MIILNTRRISIFVCLLLGSIPTSFAGQLYRFPNEDGIPTLSRSLPPEASQNGYDVFDDKTMRLIEHVPPAPTAAEIAEQKRQAALEAKRQQQAKLAAQKAAAEKQKQDDYDQKLLASYESEQALIIARDNDLDYRKEQLQQTQAKLPQLKQKLLSLQQEAANKELNGTGMTPNLEKRMQAAQQELDIAHNSIKQLNDEIKQLSTQYSKDQQRLHILLNQ